MNKYARVFTYLKNYKGQIFLYFLFVILSIVFSIVSVGMLMPFLELIFNGDQNGMTGLMKGASNPIVGFIRDFLLSSIQKGGNGIEGKLNTLGLICILIILS